MTRTARGRRPTGAAVVLAAVLAAVLAVVAGCSGSTGSPSPAGRSDAPGGGTSTTEVAEPPTPGTDTDAEVSRRFAALERSRDARLGLVAIDTGTGRTLGYRADERFALASTVKVPLAATVLDRLGSRELGRRVFWTEADLVPYSPVTETAVEDGLTVRELVGAALVESDNTAANLLFDLAGGPGAVEDRVAALGDTVTSVDRTEPELNDWRPGEPRDTSTPRALTTLVQDLLLGDALDPEDRRVLDRDLRDSVTGTGLVRAGVPGSWVVGDKSGTASYGTRNDVAVVRPPGRAPWVVVVMTSHASADAEPDDALVAGATEVLIDHWS